MPSSSSSASSTEHWISTPWRRHRRADQAGHRVARRVGQHRDGGLDLAEAERGRGGGVGREQQRVVQPVGDVRLVARRAAAAQLGHGQAELGGPEQGQHPGELGRGGARGQPDDLGPGHVRADQPAGELGVGQAHRLAAPRPGPGRAGRCRRRSSRSPPRPPRPVRSPGRPEITSPGSGSSGERSATRPSPGSSTANPSRLTRWASMNRTRPTGRSAGSGMHRSLAGVSAQMAAAAGAAR